MRPELRELLISQTKNLEVQLGKNELEKFEKYLELIQEYNQRLNLTSIKDEPGIVVKHFLDSLAGHQFLKSGWFIADLGSGMGCPGIPLKIARPSLRLILIESNHKKSAFINQVIRALGLENARAIAHNAEDKNFQLGLARQLDAILVRAFGTLYKTTKIASPYLKPNGRLVAYKGPEGEKELTEYQEDIYKHRFQLEEKFSFSLALEMGERVLLVFKKF